MLVSLKRLNQPDEGPNFSFRSTRSVKRLSQHSAVRETM